MALKFVTMGDWGDGEGSPIAPNDVDNNFYELLERIVALETTPPEAVGIESIDVTGNQMTITMTDATVHGPFTLPVVYPNPRGEWQPATNYAGFDFVTESGVLYMVHHAHISAATFDPEAEDVDGFLYFVALLPPVQPNDLTIFLSGALGDGQLIYYGDATRRWELPADLDGSFFRSQIAADAAATIELFKNGVSIGTIDWAAAGTVPTITFAAAITFEIEDSFSIVGPATADATLADISFNIRGTRL